MLGVFSTYLLSHWKFLTLPSRTSSFLFVKPFPVTVFSKYLIKMQIFCYVVCRWHHFNLLESVKKISVRRTRHMHKCEPASRGESTLTGNGADVGRRRDGSVGVANTKEYIDAFEQWWRLHLLLWQLIEYYYTTNNNKCVDKCFVINWRLLVRIPRSVRCAFLLMHF